MVFYEYMKYWQSLDNYSGMTLRNLRIISSLFVLLFFECLMNVLFNFRCTLLFDATLYFFSIFSCWKILWVHTLLIADSRSNCVIIIVIIMKYRESCDDIP